MRILLKSFASNLSTTLKIGVGLVLDGLQASVSPDLGAIEP